MNPYVRLASGTGTSVSASLVLRLTAWHDAMVAHERRLRTGGSSRMCDEECPHVDARILWDEALAAFGDRAHELTFLRSRAATDTERIAGAAVSTATRPEPYNGPAR